MREKWATLGLLLILVLSAGSILDIRVSKAEAATIVVPDDYATIQEAVDAAPVGGTVFVRSGSYFEKVRVTKPLTLLGENPKTTVISFDIEHELVNGVIEVEASDVTISGFTINGSWKGIWTPIDYTAPTRSRCKIIDNNIINNGDGISIDGENHVISGNNIKGNGEQGIILYANNSVISGNNVTGNGLSGITVGARNVTVSGNTIVGNGISEKNIGSHLRGGVMLAGDGPSYVYGNNITDNEGYGVEFGKGCYNSTVYQNNIARNSIGVNLLNFAIQGWATIGWGNIAYRNNIVDNLQQAAVEEDSKDTDTDFVYWDNEEEGNYWSDYQTKYPNAAEVGTTGTGNTTYRIDENNADNHPLMNPVTISLTPPPYLEPQPPPKPADSPLKTVAFLAAVATVFIVVLLIFKAYRKN